jgi:hypothetical protein
MKNYNPNKQLFQPADAPTPRRNLLEQSKLSRLPKLAERPTFQLPNIAPTKAAACIGCGGRLDGDDNFQQSVKVCRKCLAHYAKVDAAIDEASKPKRRELLEKFVAEVK